MMTVHCSSPQNETLARIQQLGGPDLLNATRAAAESKSSTEYNKNTIRLIIQLAFEQSPNPKYYSHPRYMEAFNYLQNAGLLCKESFPNLGMVPPVGHNQVFEQEEHSVFC